MTRLLVLVEGETEEMFVNSVLEPHLRTFGYIQVAARLLGNARQRSGAAGFAPGPPRAPTSNAIFGKTGKPYWL